MRIPAFSVAVVACLSVAGCNQTTAPEVQDTTPAVSHIGPAGYKLPEGSGCKGAVEKFRAQMDYDLKTGHTTKSVFDQVNREIDSAASLCAGGNDGGARSAIAASRSRHGYPAG